ncbi:unnamed protein product, partial [Onchocerca flexuosa]|uniref:20S proteasome subunit n=1 Tax=Onchocerca flexuosa TaxID=387005 RepID=A0A183I6D4_9BILA
YFVQILTKFFAELQANTQIYGRRPFGVGLIIAGYDERGTHIVKTDPSAEVVETLASSIGARSQSARTYLERNLDHFPAASLEQLVEFALLALRDTLPAEDSLSKKNTTIAVVGKGMPFKVMEDDDVQPFLDRIAGVPRTGQQSGSEIEFIQILYYGYESDKLIFQQQATTEPMQL